MLTKSAIVQRVDPDLYAIECEDARAAAQYVADDDAPFAFYDSDLPDLITTWIWSDDDPTFTDTAKIYLTFAVYNDLPSYRLLTPIAARYDTLSPVAQAAWWDEVRQSFTQEDDARAAGIGYILWDDFLRPDARGEMTWRELITDRSPPVVVRRVLEWSRFAPFPLKYALYRRLLPDRQWHRVVYDSLVDTYLHTNGLVTKEQAKKILAQLNLPTTTPYLRTFRRSLQSS